MAAKGLLPILGGSSAVWITCLVFFQAMLLAGYLYAHWLTRSGMRWVHLGLLAAGAATLFAAQHIAATGDAAHPVATIFRTLGVTIGLPFLLLGATSPLLQVWMARVEGMGVRYGLFALSNVGSLLGLLVYPLAIEPHVSLRHQKLGWAIGFTLYAAIAGWLSARPAVWRQEKTEPDTGQPPTPSWTRALWFLLPMGAALQLTAVTSHLTVNIAAIPLLWMLPLAAYLVSFIVAFELPRLYRRGLVVRILVVMMAGLGYALTKTDSGLPIAIGIPFFLVEMFAACLFCHAEVYRLRPSGRREATEFYLLVAAGGVAGTCYVALVSPLVFSANYDLALSFLVTAALALAVTWKDGWAQRLLWGVGTSLLLFLLVGLHIAYARRVLGIERNFYGTLRVTEADTPAGPIRMLTNGTIQHGTQIVRQPGLERMPTTYYAWDSGVGLALKGAHRIGVVGLGVGTLAAYGHPGDSIRFYEIDPLVHPLASRWFTYLQDSGATLTFADGDGRASLHRESPQNFDVLAIDAFSGDAIPLHLLTVEAMREYKRHLAPGGVLAFHVSNQYLNLAPEIAALAASSGMQARVFETPADPARGEYRAVWVLVAPDSAFFERDGLAGASIPPLPGVVAWTDDYSSLLPLVEWGRP
jgi:SAM-dependent methyltransferase